MNKNVLIITGGSKGIGNALVKTYLKNDFDVHSIARTRDENLTHDALFQYPYDLENIPQLQNLMSKIIERYEGREIEKITLINNAATLGKIGPIETISTSNLQETVELNVTVPMILCGQLIVHCQDWSGVKTVINISSGAAQKPYHGWVPYCTTKAAIEMLTKGVAKEQIDKEFPVRSIGIVPGVVETGMQEEIRKVSEQDFKSVQRFIDLKEKGMLSDPQVIAEKILSVDFDMNVENGSIVSVREN